jgi:hypothetical protein
MNEVDVAEIFLNNFVEVILELKAPPNVAHNYEPNSMHGSLLKPSDTRQNVSNPVPRIKLNGHIVIPQAVPQFTKPVNITASKNISQNYFSSTDKLNSLIDDIYVSEIECANSDAPLTVKKFGAIQKTGVRLSVDEIYELVAEFSQKTRIPVVEGRIRAALNNLVISANLSGKLGPSFIIQKIRA